MNGLVVDLDHLGQVLLLRLDVDVRVARVAEDAEVAVDAHVDARRLQQRRVVGIDLDPPVARASARIVLSDRTIGRFYEAVAGTVRRLCRIRRYGHHADRLGYAGDVATMRTIEIEDRRSPGRGRRRSCSARARVVADPLSIYAPVVVEEARGATVTDVDGNTFIDFIGGVGCLNVGHAHPRVVAAVQEQAERFLHTDFSVVPYELYVDARRAAAAR